MKKWEDCALGEIIAVLSGKGGTGKTSVCAAVSTALAMDGYRVLAIDCDVGLQNLDISLGMQDVGALSFADVCEGGYDLSQAAVHPSIPKLSFLTAPVNRSAEELDQAAFGQMLKDARALFDYIFLDAPAGVDAGFDLAAKFAQRILLVTLADPAAVRDATRAGSILELMGKNDIRLVVNRVNRKLFSHLSVTVDDVMDRTGLPLIGIVPDDPNVTLAAAFGTPLLRHCDKGAAKACRAIAQRLQGMAVPISLK